MAKRKRLNLAAGSGPDGSDMAQTGVLGPQEAKAFLRPGLGGGAGTVPIARVAAESATEAALAEVTGAMAAARAEGRLILSLPLGSIDPDHLVRDRIAADEEELGHLTESLRAHGQRLAIEVTEIGAGRYGLISGWRRMQALQRLSDETGLAKFGSVLAVLRKPADASEAYVAMVEENEVRQGLSYYERARIAARAVDLGVFASEKQALQRLFAASSRARRSKIGSFLTLFRQLDGGLRFPAAIPERLGLALARALDTGTVLSAGLLADLALAPAASASEEQARLMRAVQRQKDPVAQVRDTFSGPRPTRREARPGVFLDVSGSAQEPIITLSGPGLAPEFRAALEHWLATHP